MTQPNLNPNKHSKTRWNLPSLLRPWFEHIYNWVDPDVAAFCLLVVAASLACTCWKLLLVPDCDAHELL